MDRSTSPRTKIIISMIIWGTLGIFVKGIELNSKEKKVLRLKSQDFFF